MTDAEVFQDILHRYVAIARRDAIQPAFDLLSRVVDETFPIDRATVERAKSILLGYPRLSARDAIHVATMPTQAISRVMSFDDAYDLVPGLERLRL